MYVRGVFDDADVRASVGDRHGGDPAEHIARVVEGDVPVVWELGGVELRPGRSAGRSGELPPTSVKKPVTAACSARSLPCAVSCKGSSRVARGGSLGWWPTPLPALSAWGSSSSSRSQPSSVGGTMMTRIRRSALEFHPPRTRQFAGRIRATSAQTGGRQTPSAAQEPVAITEALSPYLKETTEQSSGVETTSTHLVPTNNSSRSKTMGASSACSGDFGFRANDPGRTTCAPDRAGNKGEPRWTQPRPTGSYQTVRPGQQANGPLVLAASQAEGSCIVVTDRPAGLAPVVA